MRVRITTKASWRTLVEYSGMCSCHPPTGQLKTAQSQWDEYAGLFVTSPPPPPACRPNKDISKISQRYPKDIPKSQWNEYVGLFVTSPPPPPACRQTKTSRTNIDLPYIPVLIMKIVIAKNICLQCYCRLLMEWWIEWSFFPFDDLVKNWNLTVLQPKQHFSSGKFTKGCRIVQWDEYAGLFVTSPPPASCCLPAKPRHLGWKNGLDREKVHCGLQMLPAPPVAKTMITQ